MREEKKERKDNILTPLLFFSTGCLSATCVEASRVAVVSGLVAVASIRLAQRVFEMRAAETSEMRRFAGARSRGADDLAKMRLVAGAVASTLSPADGQGVCADEAKLSAEIGRARSAKSDRCDARKDSGLLSVSEFLCLCLCFFLKNPTLKKRTLLDLSLEGQKIVGSGLRAVLDACCELKSLAIPLVGIDSPDTLLRIRNTSVKIRQLDLFGSVLPEATLLFLFGNVFRNLKKLNASGVRNLSKDVFKYLVKRSPKLESLSLKGHLTRVDDSFLEVIQQNLTCKHKIGKKKKIDHEKVWCPSIFRCAEPFPTKGCCACSKRCRWL